MAVDKKLENRNGELRAVRAIRTVIDTTSLTDGVENLVATLPQGAVVTAIHLNVMVAFDGTDAKLDAGIVGATNKFYDDLDITTSGDKASATGKFYQASKVDVVVVPDFQSSTVGSAVMIVEFVETNKVTGELA